ncbi:hypothetical protein RDWZM_000586, partial [Blomia tropicalis]
AYGTAIETDDEVRIWLVLRQDKEKEREREREGTKIKRNDAFSFKRTDLSGPIIVIAIRSDHLQSFCFDADLHLN